MAAPLILARTFKDAHAFAKDELGLRFGYYRVVNSAGTIKAVRGVDLYLVPGWKKRPDRFTMISAIKWCKNNVIDVENAPVEPADERWANTAYTQTIAERFHRIHFIKHEPTTIEVTVVSDETPVPQHHIDTVAKVLPSADPFTDFVTGGVHTTRASLDEAAIEEIATCIDCGLDPHTEDCASNTLEAPEPIPTVVSDEVKALDDAAPKRRRRSKCKDCEQLHYKDEACPESESA